MRLHGRARVVPSYGGLARYYDLILGDPFFADLRRMFERVVRHHQIPFSSAADVGCGTGTFVRYLGGRRIPVFGVDREPEMLRRAIEKNTGTGARFFLQDLRDLHLPQPVELITCTFDSLNYLLTHRDLRAALRGFRRNLSPGGHAIFDLVSAQPRWPPDQPRVERRQWPKVLITRVTTHDPRNGLQTARVIIDHGSDVFVETHVQRAYQVKEVVDAIAGAGLLLRAAHRFPTRRTPLAQTRRVLYVTINPGDDP